MASSSMAFKSRKYEASNLLGGCATRGGTRRPGAGRPGREVGPGAMPWRGPTGGGCCEGGGRGSCFDGGWQGLVAGMRPKVGAHVEGAPEVGDGQARPAIVAAWPGEMHTYAASGLPVALKPMQPQDA